MSGRALASKSVSHTRHVGKGSAKSSFPWGSAVMIALGVLTVIGATGIHALHPSGVYTIVSRATGHVSYTATVTPDPANAVNSSWDTLALVLLVVGLIIAFSSCIVFATVNDDGKDFSAGLQKLFGGLGAGAIICFTAVLTYHTLAHNQHQERTDEVQAKVDRWIAQNLHVPNNYDFLDNKPYVEKRPKGGDDVVVEPTVGDFVKSYTSVTTEGKAIKFTISRVKDAYSVRVVQ